MRVPFILFFPFPPDLPPLFPENDIERIPARLTNTGLHFISRCERRASNRQDGMENPLESRGI